MDLAELSLGEIRRLTEHQRRPPVDHWDPPHCGDSGIRIGADGRWHHEGRPIERPALVRLFASILRREPDGRYVLVTPVEKLAIEVEDLPFLAVELKSEGESEVRSLAFRLNSGDMVVAGPAHPIRVEPGPRPAIAVSPGLDARIARPVYYELAEAALAEGTDPPGLWSGGVYFPLDAP